MTAQTDKPKRTKAARNEIRKIKATYFNNVAVGITITGYWSPFIVASYKYYPIYQRYKSNNFLKLDEYDQFTAITVMAAVIASVIAVGIFHTLAVRMLYKLED